jgi:glycosyltransferase involved in cell wall biosynthesis
MRKTLSVAMIAMNEEANLPRTLESVKWADEIIVVDSGSKDRTIEIAESFGARTSYHVFGGHGEQKNVALDLCTSDWILLLDADEVLTPELQRSATLAGEPSEPTDSPAQPHLRPLDASRRVLPQPQAAAFNEVPPT